MHSRADFDRNLSAPWAQISEALMDDLLPNPFAAKQKKKPHKYVNLVACMMYTLHLCTFVIICAFHKQLVMERKN